MLIPILSLVGGLLKIVFGARSMFQPNSRGDFSTGRTDGQAKTTSEGAESPIGQTEMGRKRLNVLKKQASDVYFEEVEIHS